MKKKEYFSMFLAEVNGKGIYYTSGSDIIFTPERGPQLEESKTISSLLDCFDSNHESLLSRIQLSHTGY